MHIYRNDGLLSGNFGHEAVGVVAELGYGVEGLSLGQRVGVSAIAGCGHCHECREGRYTWCNDYKFFCNMHAEFFVIPALACHSLPDSVPSDVGVLITGDGLGVPYHTSTKIGGSEIKNVAVFGLGPVGLGEVMFQSYLGRRVIGVDRSIERLALAKRLGADQVISADEGRDIAGLINELTEGEGADVCIEAAGVPATVSQCFAAVRKGGTVVFNGEQPAIPLSPSDDFIRRDITAIGSWFYHFREFPEMLALYMAGMPVSSLITHRYSIDAADEAFRVMSEGRSGKVLLTYETC